MDKSLVARPEITVRLMGRVAEHASFDRASDLKGASIRLPLDPNMRSTTPRKLLNQIAEENPLLRSQIVRRDGTPRSSTRILLNGMAPDDLDLELQVRDDPADVSRRIIVVIFGDGTVIVITDIVIIVFVPCDG